MKKAYTTPEAVTISACKGPLCAGSPNEQLIPESFGGFDA